MPAPRYSSWWYPIVIVIYGVFLSACSPTTSPTVENTREQPAALSAVSSTSPLPSPTLAPSAASSPPPDPILTPSVPSGLPTITIPTPTSTIVLTPTPDTRLGQRYWRNWPIIPTLSARAFELFQHGQQLGNDVHAFLGLAIARVYPSSSWGFMTPIVIGWIQIMRIFN